MTGFDPYMENGSEVWDDRYNAGRACREYMRKCVRSAGSYYDDTPSLMRCCTSTDPVVELDCKPGFCPGSAQCGSLMKKYCATGFPAGTAFENKCKAWCLANQGQCDQSAREYCKNHPEEKDFCACLNSPLARATGGSPAIPTCFDGACIARGYQTTSMMEFPKGKCPDFCNVAINCMQETGSSCNISDVDFRNACSKTPPTPGCRTDAECPSGKCVDGKCIPPPPPKPKSVAAIVLIILLVLLALIVATVTFRSKKKEKSGGDSSGAGDAV